MSRIKQSVEPTISVTFFLGRSYEFKLQLYCERHNCRKSEALRQFIKMALDEEEKEKKLKLTKAKDGRVGGILIQKSHVKEQRVAGNIH